MLLYIYGLCISSLDQVVQLPTTDHMAKYHPQRQLQKLLSGNRINLHKKILNKFVHGHGIILGENQKHEHTVPDS